MPTLRDLIVLLSGVILGVTLYREWCKGVMYRHTTAIYRQYGDDGLLAWRALWQVELGPTVTPPVTTPTTTPTTTPAQTMINHIQGGDGEVTGVELKPVDLAAMQRNSWKN